MRSDGGSSWPRRAQRSSPAVAHCIFSPAGRRGLWLRRLTVRAGSARAAPASEGGACAWSAPGMVATSFLLSGGCPTALPGYPGSAARLCSAPPPVSREVSASPASYPSRLGGRSRVNIGRREPFAARGQGRSGEEDLFRAWKVGGLLVS